MTVLVSLLLAISVVKRPATPLKDACGEDGSVIATLEAGAPVEIRFALAGEGCYKVSVESGGRKVDGYLPGAAIGGLEDFETGLRNAAWPEEQRVIRTMAASVGGSSVVRDAANLIQSHQPAKALERLRPELFRGNDPGVLAMAGIAAWKSDDAAQALVYLKMALELEPNANVERLIRIVEKERAADRSTAKLYGLRVLLRYDADVVPMETARQMMAALDEQVTRVANEVGCGTGERLVAIVQSPEAYRKSTDAAEWSGGQYDGRIRVPVAAGVMDAPLVRVFAHESTHACLSLTGQWPAWLQEGLAQKLSGDTVPVALKARLAQMAKDGKLPRLENLHQDWSRMDAAHAALAYGLSLEAVDAFYEDYASFGIRNLVNNPDKLAGITADLDKRLGL